MALSSSRAVMPMCSLQSAGRSFGDKSTEVRRRSESVSALSATAGRQRGAAPAARGGGGARGGALRACHVSRECSPASAGRRSEAAGRRRRRLGVARLLLRRRVGVSPPPVTIRGHCYCLCSCAHMIEQRSQLTRVSWPQAWNFMSECRAQYLHQQRLCMRGHQHRQKSCQNMHRRQSCCWLKLALWASNLSYLDF